MLATQKGGHAAANSEAVTEGWLLRRVLSCNSHEQCIELPFLVHCPIAKMHLIRVPDRTVVVSFSIISDPSSYGIAIFGRHVRSNAGNLDHLLTSTYRSLPCKPLPSLASPNKFNAPRKADNPAKSYRFLTPIRTVMKIDSNSKIFHRSLSCSVSSGFRYSAGTEEARFLARQKSNTCEN